MVFPLSVHFFKAIYFTFSYYTLILWFAENFDRFSKFSKQHPGESLRVCQVFKVQPLRFKNGRWSCYDLFLDTTITRLSCILTSTSLSYFMLYKIGKKAVLGKTKQRYFFIVVVLVLSLVLSGLCTLSFNWDATQGQILALSCVFEVLTSILEAQNYPML